MSAEMKSQNKAHNSGFLSFFGSKLYQKNLMWWIPLLTAAFICLYSLLMCTPIGVLENVIDTPYTNHPEWGNRLMGDICVEMKPYNDMVIIVGIFAVILVLLYKFTRSNIRKNYYISNIVYSVANIVYFIFAGVSLFMVVAKYQDLYFNYQDFDAIKEALSNLQGILPIDASWAWVFYLGYLLGAISIICAIGMALLLVNKFPNFIAYMKLPKSVRDSDKTANTYDVEDPETAK